MKKLTLEEVKQIQLEIMDDVHAFCMRNGIRYSLAGGSLLGAVKHKGYVPMDDDIDIMLPRPDYERFIKEYKSDVNTVLNLSEVDSCREQFSKVCRKNTILVDPLLGRKSFMIFIDVCPIDGAPMDRTLFFHSLRKKIDLIPRVCKFYKDVPSRKVFWFIKYIMKRLLCRCPHGVLVLKKEINEMLASHAFDSSPYAAELLVVDSESQILDSSVFKLFEQMEFEGREYCVISHYDEYLLSKYSRYGHYMNLPKLSAPVHRYDAYEI